LEAKVIPNHVLIAGALVALSGCGNIDNAQSVRFGDVSVGQQNTGLIHV
jgi:hypothetical protein